MTDFSDLYLWLGGTQPGFCKVTAGEGARLPGDPEKPGTRYPVGIARDESLACLVTRKLPGSDHEFGTHAYGPHAASAAAALIGGIQAWDRHGRHLAGDAFAYYRTGSTPPQPADGLIVVSYRKRHGTLVTQWGCP
jgi:protein-L-isoaspartate(D-aspartate) O-methyltransferase